jgi:dipeptidyl aminopeptidase/acylaminoacyl peptidase
MGESCALRSGVVRFFAMPMTRRCNLLVALAAVLIFPNFAHARFTLEQVLSSPFPSQLRSASNANRIVWAVNHKGVRNIWIADAPAFVPRQVTNYGGDAGQAIASVRLTPDGKTVVYIRGTETNTAGEVANPTSSVHQPHQEVWAVDVDGGSPRNLGLVECSEEGCADVEISPDGKWVVWSARKNLWIAPVSGSEKARQLLYMRGNNSTPRWSPDSNRIAFVSDRGDHSYIAVYDFGSDTVRYVAPSVDRDGSPRWSPDGKLIAFLRRPGKQRDQSLIPLLPVPWSILVANPFTGEAQVAWRSGKELTDSYPELTEDDSFNFAAGNRIVFASEHDGYNHLYSISADGGAATLLTPGKFEVEDVQLVPDRKTVLYSSNQDDIDRRHIWRVPVAGGTPQALSRGETIEWSPIELADRQTVVCLGSSATTPAMPYRLTAAGREMIAASTLPADFPSSQLVTPKQVIFKSEDGWEIHGQLFTPTGLSGKAPALIFIHGGSMRQMVLGFHSMNYYHNAYAENEYLASLGYVVLSVNYRTGVMYGRAFREVKDGGWRGVAEYKDIVAAAKYLRSLPDVDSHKIGLWGGSYGGYLTAMGLARNSDLFAAGVDFHGVHDWSVFLDDYAGPNSGTVPDMQEAKKLAFESSPNSSIGTWHSPVLLIQGDDDRDVPFSQTVDLAQRLRAQGVPFEQIVLPDEIHGFLLYRSWLQTYGATADFFEKTLKQGQKLAPENGVASSK